MADAPPAQFRVLGETGLTTDGAEALLAGPKRVGLLAYLALARPRGFHRRDALLPLFWPWSDQRTARNALSNLLHHVRKALGAGVVVNRGGEEVGLAEGRLWTDAVAFDEALDRGDARAAMALYRGDLLDGFHLRDAAPAFGDWLDRERERLRGRAAEAALALSHQDEMDGATACDWARRACALAPLSEEAHARVIDVLWRAGDRAGALAVRQAFGERLRSEWDIEPSPALDALADRIRTPQGEEGLGAPAVASPRGRMIAVLPFDDVGGGSSATYADGVHGDLLTRLSTVSDLDVISRTSVRRYRGSERSAPDIGAELGARWILEGEVQEADGQVRVTVRLVEAAADRQVWAAELRRPLTAGGLFEIQAEITREIVGALAATLAPSEEAAVALQPTQDLAAYRLCVQGRALLDERTEAGMRRALASFERAAALDPGFALAWVGVGDARALLHDYGYEDADRALPGAEQAIRRALTLDPRSAEAHASLGALHAIRHEGARALEELRRAVELRPGYGEAHNWLSWTSMLLGHGGEALGHARRAVVLNPLSPEAVSNLTLSYLVNGALETALAEARRGRELGSEWGTGAFYEGLILYEAGRFEESASVLEDLLAPWAGHGPQATRALALVRSGAPDAARRLAEGFGGDPFACGLIHAALGDLDRARSDFHRVEAWGHWPTLAVRYFYGDVWGPPGGGRPYPTLLSRVDADWGLAPAPAQRGR